MIEAIIFTLAQALGLAGAAEPNIKYVSKGGSDAAGTTGSFFKPFLTIQAAITAIGSASTSTQPYAIAVAPGTYTDAFALQPWQFIVGAGRNLTVLSNPAANWIGTGFAAAGSQDAGIVECKLGTSIVVNFADAAILSPGAGRFFLYDSLFDSTVSTITGNNNANRLELQNLHQIGETAALTHTWANVFVNASDIFVRANNVTHSNNAAYAVVSRIADLKTAGNFTVSCASTANSLNVVGTGIATSGGQSTVSVTLTGDGAVLSCPTLTYGDNPPDADVNYSFGTTAGARKLVGGGDNMITLANWSSAHTLTVTGNTTNGTRIRIKNATGFAQTLVFTGTVSIENPSYIPAGDLYEVIMIQGGYQANNAIQSGSVALTAGVSALIPADISAASTITAMQKTRSGVCGTIVAKSADRVIGTRAGGGGFKLTSVDNTTGATVITDIGTYDWHVKAF